MLPDSEILPCVRRLRSYLATVDNSHWVLEQAELIEDKGVAELISQLKPDIISVGQRMSQVLRLIETSKPYRDMVKKYNLKEEEENERE